jgi:hypothetical protein
MAHEQSRDADDDDHDLLTFSESGVRLTEEIALVETELRTCSDAALREHLEGRRANLQRALERNSRYADTRPGEQGFLTYDPPATV